MHTSNGPPRLPWERAGGNRLSFMSPEVRHEAIIAALSAHGTVEVADLSDQLGVSGTTIRRDLAVLEGRSVLRRTHGGAIRTNFAGELPLGFRETKQAPEKGLIAAAVAAMVAENLRIGLSGGTTLTEVARALGPAPGLTVVTNSLSVASEMAPWSQHTLITTGGLVRDRSYEMVGPVAEQTIARFNLDLCIVGADGVSVHGITTLDHVEAATNRALVESAKRCVVAADHTKLGKTLFATICDLADVDMVLTTGTPDERLAEALQRHGVELMMADAASSASAARPPM